MVTQRTPEPPRSEDAPPEHESANQTSPFSHHLATLALALLGGTFLSACGQTVADGLTQADAGGASGSCSTCHGSADSPAPPRDLQGQSDPTRRGVGAHRGHLRATHRLSKAVTCSSCHVVPLTPDSPGHRDSPWPAEVRFGGLAVAGAARPRLVAPLGTGDESKDSALSVSCASVYCHGATLSGGTDATPEWSATAPERFVHCRACHGYPPALKADGQPHPASTACGTCHGMTVSTADGTHIAHPENHINGRVDLDGDSDGGFEPVDGSDGGSGGEACNACHGDLAAAGTAPSDPGNAPPRDTHGNSVTTAIGVGAHQAHLRATRSAPVPCSTCHVVPLTVDAPGHNVGSVAAVRLAGLASADGVVPKWDRVAGTCSVYCHGQTMTGGSDTSPQWTRVDGTQARCGACHGLPPPAPHPQSAACAKCHDTVASDGVTIAKPAQHVDGKVDAIDGKSCASCHGSAANAAPPKDTHGNSATTAIGVGAHQSHLSASKLSAPIECNECHTVPTSMTHSDGKVGLTWGPLAKTKGLAPAFDTSAATCANTWCHAPVGYGLALAGTSGGLNSKPTWTTVGGTQASCGACHGVPPYSGAHLRHALFGCGSCHAGYSIFTVDKTLHVDGQVQLGGSAMGPGSFNSGVCTPSCHGVTVWGLGGG